MRTYWFLWKRLCFNYPISTLRLKARLFESNLFWVGQHDPFLNLYIAKRTNPVLM